MEIKPGNTYTCAHCKRQFVSNWSVEEANAMAKKTFGTDKAASRDDQLLVCGKCFKLFMRQLNG